MQDLRTPLSTPAGTLKRAGGPASWLGYDRYDTEFRPTEWEVKVVGMCGALRGITTLSMDKLARARRCIVTPIPGGYHVRDPKSPDTEGEYVNLDDPQVERCYCEDFIFRCETVDAKGHVEAQPCKHILAALLFTKDPQLDEFVKELEQRDRLAEAVTKAVVA